MVGAAPYLVAALVFGTTCSGMLQVIHINLTQ